MTVRWHNEIPAWIVDANQAAAKPIRGGAWNMLQEIANACEQPHTEDEPLLGGIRTNPQLADAIHFNRRSVRRFRRDLERSGVLVVLSWGRRIDHAWGTIYLGNVYGLPAWPGQLDAFSAPPGECRGSGLDGRWTPADSGRIRAAIGGQDVPLGVPQPPGEPADSKSPAHIGGHQRPYSGPSRHPPRTASASSHSLHSSPPSNSSTPANDDDGGSAADAADAGFDLLMGIGTNESDARELASKHAAEKIAAWIAEAQRRENIVNVAGFVRRALEGNWPLPVQPISESRRKEVARLRALEQQEQDSAASRVSGEADAQRQLHARREFIASLSDGDLSDLVEQALADASTSRIDRMVLTKREREPRHPAVARILHDRPVRLLSNGERERDLPDVPESSVDTNERDVTIGTDEDAGEEHG